VGKKGGGNNQETGKKGKQVRFSVKEEKDSLMRGKGGKNRGCSPIPSEGNGKEGGAMGRFQGGGE